MNTVRALPLPSLNSATPWADIDVAGFVRVLELRVRGRAWHGRPALLVLCDERPTVHRLRIQWVPIGGEPENLNALTYLGEEAGGVLFLHPVERHPSGWRAAMGTQDGTL